MTLTERIQNKINQIEKLERLYTKYATDAEEKSIIDRFLETGSIDEYRTYLRAHNRSYGGDAWSKAHELYDARQTLAKYQKQFAAEESKNLTLANMPESLIQFKSDLIERWNRYDEWKYNTIRSEWKELEQRPYQEWRENYKHMNEKWGRNWHDFAYHYTLEDAYNNNRRDADNLVLNLIKRTVELCGKITDATALRLDRDNAGYSIINGIVIGENGRVRIESIGAGGYNIQRYHIRVLVHKIH